MTLTVPKAGTSPGRAPELRAHQSTTGAAVAELGDIAFSVGTALENERLSREASRLQVDLTRDMNRLRLEAEEIGDPDQLEAFWKSRSDALRNEYLTGTDENGRPRVDPKNHERFGLAFDELAGRHEFAIGAQALTARHSQREAYYLAYEHEVTTTGAQMDPDTREQLLAGGDAHIDQLVADGVISAEEGQRRKMNLRGDTANAAAIAQISADPQGFLDAADEGIYGDLDADSIARYRVQAQNALDRAAEAALTEAEREERTRQKAIGSRLTEITKILDAGRTPVDLDWLNQEDVKEHPNYGKAMAALALQQEIPGLAQMTIAELNEQIAIEADKPVEHEFQTERLSVLTEARDQALTDWAKDPRARAEAVGLAREELPEFSADDPQTYVDALARRAAEADFVIERGHTDQFAVFSAAERKQLKETFGPGGDPKERAAWAMSVAAALGSQGIAVARAATGDELTAYAVNLLGQGAPVETVEDMMTGQRRLADKTVGAMTAQFAREAFSAATNGEFDGQLGAMPQLMAATQAIYAGAGGDPKDIDGELYEQSLQLALGATPGQDGDLTVGGLQELDTVGTTGWDNYRVALIPGVSREATQRAMEAIAEDPALLNAMEIEGAELDFVDPKTGRDMASQIGGWLRLGAIWADGRPTGQYYFYREEGGRPTYLYRKDGELARFNLIDIVRELGR